MVLRVVVERLGARTTVHHDVKPTSSANSTSDEPNSAAIGVFTVGLASRRARSETSSSSASSTKFATTDEPP